MSDRRAAPTPPPGPHSLCRMWNGWGRAALAIREDTRGRGHTILGGRRICAGAPREPYDRRTLPDGPRLKAQGTPYTPRRWQTISPNARRSGPSLGAARADIACAHTPLFWREQCRTCAATRPSFFCYPLNLGKRLPQSGRCTCVCLNGRGAARRTLRSYALSSCILRYAAALPSSVRRCRACAFCDTGGGASRRERSP